MAPHAWSGLGALALVAACSGAELAASAPPPGAEGTTCRGTQALSATSFTGASLAAKEIALTFDDGPGSRTLELSAYLKAQGIRAAFFVNGHCFGQGNGCGNPGLSPAQVFTQLVADGHILANHTQSHRDLTNAGYFPSGASGDAAIVAALADTDAILAPYVEHSRFLFRPPYGAWSARDYSVLHASAMDKYIGPVRWDVGGAMTGSDATGFAADWDCWQNQSGFGVKTTAKCAGRYLNEIHAVGRAITLMHDSDNGNMANHDVNVGKGNTIDMVKRLVPQLKAEGYTFVRLDEVPSIAAALPPIPPPPPVDAGPADADGKPVPDSGAQSSSSSSSSGGSSGSVPRVEPPRALDPCASADSAPQEYPYSAQVH